MASQKAELASPIETLQAHTVAVRAAEQVISRANQRYELYATIPGVTVFDRSERMHVRIPARADAQWLVDQLCRIFGIGPSEGVAG